MNSVLFEARLSDPLTATSTRFSCILFGADSLSQKEQRFRLMCQSKYPYLYIAEPIVVRPMALLGPIYRPGFVKTKPS
jgi:hypothetical protein